RAMQWFYWAHFSLESLLWYKAAQSVFEKLSKSEQDAMFLTEEILGVSLNVSNNTAQKSSNASNASDLETVLG
ncbi:MAG: hypothetical protein ACK4XM_12625, partial [Chloroherpetonaceae bacterium]